MPHRVPDNQPLSSLRACQSKATAERTAVVTKIKGVATEGERAEEVINHPGQVVEGVCEFLRWWRVGMTEARQVGSDEMEKVPKALEGQVIHPR